MRGQLFKGAVIRGGNYLRGQLFEEISYHLIVVYNLTQLLMGIRLVRPSTTTRGSSGRGTRVDSVSELRRER